MLCSAMRCGVTLLLAVMLAAPLSAEEFSANNATLDRLNRVEAELSALKSNLQDSNATVGEDYFTTTTSSGGFIGGVELTFLAPQTGTLAASGTILGNPIGSVQLVPKYESFASVRLWGGYRNAQGLGGRVRYWDINANASGDFDGVPLDTRQSALALDVEGTQVMEVGLFELDASLGLRWGKIGRQALFPFNTVLAQSFNGVGPTAALWARRPLGNSNFSLVGGGRSSMLYGNNDYLIRLGGATGLPAGLPAVFGAPSLPAPAPGQPEGLTLTAQHAAVMVYELQAGVEWSRIMANDSRLFVRVQGEAQIWQVPSLMFGLLDNTTGFVGVSTAAGIDW